LCVVPALLWNRFYNHVFWVRKSRRSRKAWLRSIWPNRSIFHLNLTSNCLFFNWFSLCQHKLNFSFCRYILRFKCLLPVSDKYVSRILLTLIKSVLYRRASSYGRLCILSFLNLYCRWFYLNFNQRYTRRKFHFLFWRLIL